MHTDLFNQSSADWVADPRRTFDAWLSARHFRGSSADVYRAQWNHFLDWLNDRGRTLLNTEPSLIDEFAATLDVKRQQRARYLRIMERVFDDMFQERPAAGNPARPVARAIDAPWTDTRSNAPTGFLSETERMQLWAAFEQSVAENGVPLHWRDLRDRAMGAMLLGTGLKLSEAETLPLSSLALSERSVRIEGTDPRYVRLLPLSEQTTTIVERWMVARQQAGVDGELVFPAGRGGRAMHKATVLRAIDTIVEGVGLMNIRNARISPQTLRNAYAATLFESGESDEFVAERLGFAQLLSAKRLRTAWLDWQRNQARQDAIRAAVDHSRAAGAMVERRNEALS